MEVAIEDQLFEFLSDAIEAAVDGEPLFAVALHDTVYQEMDDAKSYYLQIGPCDSELAPPPGAETVEEFDGDVVIVALARVDADDYTERRAARTKVIAMAKAVAKLFIEDPTAGGRLNDVRVLRVPRDWTKIVSQPYAVANIPLIVNESGGGNG